ncbi:hypothetical protein [Halosegnis marinus]|uniref:Uncharacterized protein n=1 Tax=Halosegnis marinus TaxID=3034023 RepID=A0ABD5ZL85_9EURY|nr:hypothetical protein [Halosegnis sp. DT85]
MALDIPILAVGAAWLLLGSVSVRRPHDIYRRFRPDVWADATVRRRDRSATRVRRFGYLLAGCGLGALAIQFV